MESVYQYIWKFRLAGTDFTLTDGKMMTVLDPGVLNNNAGPDFFNAKIIIDGTEWAGNVEIHMKSSDWFRHKHDSDRSYDSVILHVVARSDSAVFRSDGSEIPTLELKVSQSLLDFFSSLTDKINNVRCQPQIFRLSHTDICDWLETLAIERLQAKSERILNIYASTNSDWEQTCFITLARSLGFGLNSEPFERLATGIPLKILHHHSDNQLQLEAIIFGQAGFLDSSKEIFNEYYQHLCREYYFLAKKYGLRPSSYSSEWKLSRTRPQNFPFRRLAYLASAAKGGFSLMRKMLDTPFDPESFQKLFLFDTEGYWSAHYNFHDEKTAGEMAIGMQSVNLILINAAAPLLYAYGAMRNEPEQTGKALLILEKLPPENNAIIRGWGVAGIKAISAADSQALLQLRKEYCDMRKCLYCRFGNKLLRSVAMDPEEEYITRSQMK